MTSHAITFVKGFLIGIANIIPGVSGGTFALLLGIYERLIGALAAIGTQTVKVAGRLVLAPHRRESWSALGEELKRLDAVWLAVLLAGAAAAILASSHLIAYLLDYHRAPTLAFFIGLILPSIAVPYSMMERRGPKELVACIAGCGLLVAISLGASGSGVTSGGLVLLFISGAIAISAMILPGISGSFVLMVMGQYRAVLGAINEVRLVELSVFACGCVLGLIGFVKLLQFLLRRYRTVVLAFLVGLILGSLWVLWPFKHVAEGAKIITGTNYLPAALDGEVLVAIAAFVAGACGALGVNHLGKSEADSPVAGVSE
ncbi:MAG: DUF368 domain-containing protein [Deltaproteobacteria bacterium]|nr:MAG: DUF368 domain-containing protein [Deltaproteobacteria bacterium]